MFASLFQAKLFFDAFNKSLFQFLVCAVYRDLRLLVPQFDDQVPAAAYWCFEGATLFRKPSVEYSAVY